MASHKEFMVEWTMLDNDCNNWTLQDLQLAAELGKTLLERNEELEKDLKHQQAIIDDQAQEIEFLTKQANSMKEESATRAKVYEQLESSIYELERTNTQLSRKHEIDKQRIQSLLENIEFLERKCEEMTGTLESIRDENKKSYGGSKMSRSSYFNFGSGSSDEEIQGGFPLYRRRSHSLHDLRDCSSSPDDFDSNNSNSPDLKTSEAEFIETLESRIEELLAAKRKESEKIQQLESQIRLLVQENAGLQQQIVELTSEKDEEITELRKQLLDSSSYTQFQLPPLNESLLTSTTLPFKTSSRRNSHISNSCIDSTSGAASMSNPSLRSFVSLCKRCSTEINLLNLVNSIEVEHDSENYENFLSYDNEDDMEFSSLEHELARATGNAFDNHNHSHNQLNSLYQQHSSFHYNNNHLHHYHLNEPASTDTDTGSSSNVSRCKCRNLTTKRKQSRHLFPNPSEIPVDEMDYENSEIFDIFFNQEDKDEVGEEAKENPDDMSNKASGSSEEEEDNEENEDPCLLKDRKPEFAVKSKPKNKAKQKLCSSSSAKVKKFKSSSKDSCCGNSTSSGCSSAAATYSSTGTGHCTDSSRQSSPVVIASKNSKLELPTRIPTDDEDEEEEGENHNSIIIVDKYQSTATLALKNRKGCDISRSDQVDGANGDGQQLSLPDNLVLDETHKETDKETSVEIKRSKFWLLAWLVLVVLGVFECIWALLSLMFFLVTAAILPGRGSARVAASSPSAKKLVSLSSTSRMIPLPAMPLVTSSRKL